MISNLMFLLVTMQYTATVLNQISSCCLIFFHLCDCASIFSFLLLPGLKMIIQFVSLFVFFQILIHLVGADNHTYPNYMDIMQWLADTNLPEMIVDKLSPSVSALLHTIFPSCRSILIIQ